MTYLELVRELAEVSGTLHNADPVSEQIDTLVAPDTQYLVDLKRWINNAWTSLQLSADWRFLQKEGTFDTVASQQEYVLRGSGNLVPDFRKLLPYVKQSHGYRYIRVGDKETAAEVHWDNWTGVEERLDLGESRPKAFTVTPNDSIRLAPTPDGVYTVRFNYLRQPQVLSADGDEPIMPSELHQVIVYRAMILYAGYDEANSQYQRIAPEYRELRMRLRNSQLPDMRIMGSD